MLARGMSVGLCICMSLWTWYFINASENFHHIYNSDAAGDKDGFIRLFSQKVKGQGRNRTKCAHKSTFVPFCHHRRLNDDSLNWSGFWMCNWWVCNLGQNEVKCQKMRLNVKVHDQTICGQKQWMHVHDASMACCWVLSSSVNTGATAWH